jgi:uncharacterized membrane protein
MIETSGAALWLIILGMSLATLAARWGGIFIMSFIPLGYRVKLFIQSMSSSVLVAIVAPMALEGDMAARLALLTSVVMMLLLKKQLLAISAGILVAILIRQLA